MPEKINITADLDAAQERRVEDRRHSAFDASLLVDRANRLEERNAAYFEQIVDLKNLIHWLALKYGDKNPEFPEYDPNTKTWLVGNIALSRTWYEVVRAGVRCEECKGAGHFKVTSDDPDIKYLRTCEACEGLGFTESPA